MTKYLLLVLLITKLITSFSYGYRNLILCWIFNTEFLKLQLIFHSFLIFYMIRCVIYISIQPYCKFCLFFHTYNVSYKIHRKQKNLLTFIVEVFFRSFDKVELVAFSFFENLSFFLHWQENYNLIHGISFQFFILAIGKVASFDNETHNFLYQKCWALILWRYQ